MVRKIATVEKNGFDWLDIFDPYSAELMELAHEYGLHEALVKDCLQPGHLPKYEQMDKYSFIIFRIHIETNFPTADTVQELTHKIAIFYSDTFILTIHRQQQPLIDLLTEQMKTRECTNTAELFNLLVHDCLNTYQEPLNVLDSSVDTYEEVIFLKPKKIPQMKGLYYLKRKIDLIRRMLRLTADIIDFVDSETGNADTREIRDQYVKYQSTADSLSENVQQLLSVYFSASSQRTNDTMRILTIFSVFFMPLTFIVGIYGMNFDFMPELRSKYGYPVVLVLMVIVTGVIYGWFKRKEWL